MGRVPLLDRCVERVQIGVQDRGLAHERMFASARDGPALDSTC
jgi:hypothetical protein